MSKHKIWSRKKLLEDP